MRTLPLIPAFKELLLHKQKQQNEFQRMCGKSYNKDYLGYICVDEMGRLLSPHYLTEAFAKLLGRIHPGAVVLLHSTSQTNAEIMDELLTKWEEMGYQFKSLDQLAGGAA